MKQTFYTLLFIFFFLNLAAQSSYKHNILSFPSDQDKKNLKPNYKAYKKELRKKYDSIFDNKEEENEFIHILVDELKKDFVGGNIYTNWKEGEEYLNQIFKSILPDSTPQNVNIKIIRTTDVNAFMTASGQAYITVGFLAEALNEAEIVQALGHEYGHYLHNDSYKRFKEVVAMEKNYKIGRLFASSGGELFYLISTSNSFGGFRDMEREADKTGMELVKRANYNLLGLAKVMERFKMIEQLKQKQKDRAYHSGIFYFNDHPPTEERIKYTYKEALTTDTLGAPYFKISQQTFQKIKLQAIDECVTLLLQEQNYQDCMELCYRQLLFYPNDEFYLFYINEALRRYLLLKPKEADNFFITSQYNLYSKYVPKNKQPKFVQSSKYAKASSEILSQSVFYHYEYLKLSYNNKLIIPLPDNELTRTDTLQFITNQDALNYFTSKQKQLKQSSVSWVENCSADKIQDINVNSSEDILNKYNEIKKDLVTFIANKEDSIIPVILINAQYAGRPAIVSRNDINKDSIPKQCARYLKTYIQPSFDYKSLAQLNPSEHQAFDNLIDGMLNFKLHSVTITSIEPKIDKYEKAAFPLLFMSPEITSLLNKYNLQKFILLNIIIADGWAIKYVGTALNYHASFNDYFFDFKNGSISHISYKETIGSNAGLQNAIQHLNQYLPLMLEKK